MAAGPTYEKIQSVTLLSDQASIDFTAITNAWTDLKISYIGGQSANNDAWIIRFNGDTGANYTSSYFLSGGSTPGGGCSNDTTAMSNFGDLGGAGIETLVDINVNSYAETNRYKSVLSNYASKQRNRVNFNAQLWRSNSAITDIKFLCTGTDLLKAGSIATLYGIAAA
jgi:hypothetical protein